MDGDNKTNNIDKMITTTTETMSVEVHNQEK